MWEAEWLIGHLRVGWRFEAKIRTRRLRRVLKAGQLAPTSNRLHGTPVHMYSLVKPPLQCVVMMGDRHGCNTNPRRIPTCEWPILMILLIKEASRRSRIGHQASNHHLASVWPGPVSQQVTR